MRMRRGLGDEQQPPHGAIRPNPDHNKAAACATKVVCLLAHDQSMRKALTRLTESAGYKVRGFSEAQAFLAFVASNFVAVAVLDTWIERMTAEELLAQARVKSPNTKLIFLTGLGDRLAQTTAMVHRTVESLVKPLDTDKFLATIGHAFAERGLTEARDVIIDWLSGATTPALAGFVERLDELLAQRVRTERHK